MIENLETRVLLSFAICGGTLTVEGDENECGNVIIVEVKSSKEFKIIENDSEACVSGRFIRKIILKGGDGCDWLQIVNGDNIRTFKAEFFGKDGDDTMMGGLEADKFNGGDGCDRVTYEGRNDCLNLSINDLADDGAPGEMDDIRNDCEEVIGGCGNDLIIGNDYPNYLDGGPGDDIIYGKGGCDLLVGGFGKDSLNGGEGDDVFQAVDGERDTVVGDNKDYDTAFADCIDLLACIKNIYFAPVCEVVS